MSDLASSWNHFKYFDELVAKRTVIHRIHPVAKLLTTVFFLLVVVSFGKYEIIPLLPLFLYPVVLISLADLPAGELFKRTLIAAPFALGIGIFNPFFDHTGFIIGQYTISGGWLSFISIVLRVELTVLAALILVAVSGIGEVATALFKLRFPRLLVIQLLFMYRYLSLLIEGTARIVRANSLRSAYRQGLQFKVWGSLVGQLLLRTIDRAERIYQAMRCRGFEGKFRLIRQEKFRIQDGIFILIWSGFFLLVRFVNLPEFIGRIITGGF